MKKVLLFGAVVAVLAITSCEKKHTCTISGVEATYSESDYSSSELSAIKASCELSGGTWK